MTIDPVVIDAAKSWAYKLNNRKYFDMEVLIILYVRESARQIMTFVVERHFDIIDKENTIANRFRYRHIGPYFVNMISRKNIIDI